MSRFGISLIQTRRTCFSRIAVLCKLLAENNKNTRFDFSLSLQAVASTNFPGDACVYCEGPCGNSEALERQSNHSGSSLPQLCVVCIFNYTSQKYCWHHSIAHSTSAFGLSTPCRKTSRTAPSVHQHRRFPDVWLPRCTATYSCTVFTVFEVRCSFYWISRR